MIPRVIHRIWLDEEMPGLFAAFGEAWERLHPGWVVRDWTSSADIHDSLRGSELITEAKGLFPRDWRRFQADVLRLSILAEWGGLYVDTDVEPHRNVEPLLAGRTCVVGRSPQSVRGEHPITNCVMAAVPGHPWVLALIAGLEDALRMNPGKSLAQTIGPWHLERTYRSGDWPTMTVLSPQELFAGGWLTHWWNTARRKNGRGLA